MSDSEIKDHINEYGWHYLFVFDPGNIKPDFSYSIGFEETYNHPEIMIFGLKRETAHGILTDIADDLKEGIRYEKEIKTNEVIGGDFDAIFKEVKEEAFEEYLGTAVNYYKKPFRAWVLFWPDKNNRLPTEKNCNITVQDEALKIV